MAKNTKPAIRFKGFTDDWEQRKLGDLGTTFTGLSGKTAIDFGHGEASFITYMNVFTNPVSNPKMVEHVEIDSKQREVEVGDVFFTTSSETPEEVGMSSVLKEKSGVMYLNSFCFGFRPLVKFDLDYLAFMLRSESVRKQIKLLAQGISRFNISKTKMMDIEIPLSKIDEQVAIGRYFAQLDNLITLHQRKYDSLVNVKKAMLEKMFPKNSESVPEIRFKGFTDAWEQRKLGELASLITKGTTPLDKSGDGEINFIKVENIDSASGEITPEMKISEAEHNGYLKRSQLQEHDILFSIAGTLGRVSIVKSSFLPANTNQALAIIRTKEGDLNYLTTVLKGNAVADFIKRNPTIGAQPNLSLEQVGNLKIPYPSMKEQAVIGAYFKYLDHLITLHQRKLEKLKNIKKSCLEKMFV